MWSPVAAIKKSFRTTSNDSDDLPPPALLNEGDDMAETPSAEPRRSRMEDAGMWSPVAALKRSFRRSKATSSSSSSSQPISNLPPAGLLNDEDLQDVNLSTGELETNDHNANSVGNTNDGNQKHHESEDPTPKAAQNADNETIPTDSSVNREDDENEENEEDDDVEKNIAPSGFNTRLSGFNTQLLPDDDFGDLVDDDEEDEDDENYQEPKSDDEFDFGAQSDDDLIDRAFFGVDVSDSEGEEYFNEWYLMDDEEGFLAPILFEDGMNSDECDLYYITLEEDTLRTTNPSPHGISMARRSLPTKFRSALPLRTFEEEDEDELPSCLRESKDSRQIQEEIVPFRRRSFSGLPDLHEPPEFYRAHSCPDLSTLHAPHHQPKVNFDTEVQVVTVFAASDYPRKIRSNLWFTKKQIRASRKEASYERRRERRQREKDEAAGRGTF